MRIAVLNGPNLNLLGTREPELYGHESLDDIERSLALGRRRASAPSWNSRSTTVKGSLIDAIHALRGRVDGVVINAGAYTHTSLAIRDALAAIDVPFVEVHLTNIYAREPERRHSMLASAAVGVVCTASARTATSSRCADSLARSASVADPRPARLAALADGLTAAHVDGLLVSSLPNIRYLTGFSGSSALLFVTPRDVVFITDFRYQTQVQDEVGDLAQVTIEPQSLWSGLWHQLAQVEDLEVAGFESAHLLHRDFQRLLEAGARWQWRPTVDLVETLRERKDPGELALIEAANGIAARALERTVPQSTPA